MKKRPIKTIMRALFPSLFILARGMKLLFSEKSFLVKSGYVESIKTRRPCTKDGNPLPWMNYQVIHFLNDRLHKGLEMFEYGSGYSTAYYAERAGAITSVEHHKGWFDIVEQTKPNNATLFYRGLDDSDAYCNCSSTQGKAFDIVVVDGRERVKCMESALKSLKDGGVILLDDSLRSRYQSGIDLMLENGFRKLDFLGLKPGGLGAHQTTIFYKDNNCLKL